MFEVREFSLLTAEGAAMKRLLGLVLGMIGCEQKENAGNAVDPSIGADEQLGDQAGTDPKGQVSYVDSEGTQVTDSGPGRVRTNRARLMAKVWLEVPEPELPQLDLGLAQASSRSRSRTSSPRTSLPLLRAFTSTSPKTSPTTYARDSPSRN